MNVCTAVRRLVWVVAVLVAASPATGQVLDSAPIEPLFGSTQVAIAAAGASLASGNADPSWLAELGKAFRSPWLVQLLAGAIVFAVVWIALHWLRDGWRWLEPRTIGRWRSRRSWTFAGMVEDRIGAREAVLDAIRRVPLEVALPTWSPTSLLLYWGSVGWEVWEDFAVDPLRRASPIHEPPFTMLLKGGASPGHAEAFQNLQFAVGGVPVGAVAQAWKGLIDWWRTGSRSISAAAHEVIEGDRSKAVTVRLTASSLAGGTVSVMAATEQHDGVDVVALSADRAAYKLLSMIGPHHDSPRQIDGHAAFRQGTATLKVCLSAVDSIGTARERRAASLAKAIANLEFARQTFDGDVDHRVYYLEAVRFQAVASACAGEHAASLRLFEELLNATAISAAGGDGAMLREARLHREAQYNSTMLRWNEARSGGADRSAALVANSLLFQLTASEDRALATAARVWQLRTLAESSPRQWESLAPDSVAKTLRAAAGLPLELETAARQSTSPVDRRCYGLLASSAQRALGVSQLRAIAAFEQPARARFGGGGAALPDDLRHRVWGALEWLDKSAPLGALSSGALSARGYGLLLQSRWRDAEEAAAQALAVDKTDQFAVYVAAEAALQRGDVASARRYAREVPVAPIHDRELAVLVQMLFDSRPPRLTA